ncbi:hypothetical protein PHISCL_00682 [Aspergillus sclerotialis]|uniref:Uncharacterized protein n=1 Tax=Aspergillus sclerotialis TaxID=2070753 RepID=A0A3A3ACD3_9EURO|nr:hypothetical protein PHISCL_00682 [Aspergillus sclerotialis]
MPKKGGKKKSGKGKAASAAAGAATGAGAAAAAKTVADVHDTQTPGHEVEENVNKAEGEVEPSTETAADASTPEAAAKIPSAAPPQVTEEETKAAGESLTAAEKDSVQDAVDKTSASKEGKIGSLDTEESVVLPEDKAKESRLTSETFAPEQVSVSEKATDKEPGPVAPATECVGENTPVAEKPEEVKAPAGEDATPFESGDSAIHTKRPDEKGIFTQEEESKLPKMPKAEDEAPDAATSPSAGIAADTTSSDANAKSDAPAEAAGLTEVPPADKKAEPPTASGVDPEAPTERRASTVSRKASEPMESLGAAAAGVTSTGTYPDKADTELHQKEKELKAAQDKLETHEHGKKSLVTESEKKEVEKEEKAEAKKLEQKEQKEEKKLEKKAEEKAEKKEEKKPETQPQQPEPAKLAQEQKPTAPAQAQTETQKPAEKPADKSQEEAAKAEKKKGGFWSWIKRKVKG